MTLVNLLSLRTRVASLLLPFLFVALSATAKKPDIKIALLQPEWHGTTVCKTAGLALNAPSISLMFTEDPSSIKDSRYAYKWEQKSADGTWTVVKEEANAALVPAFKLDGVSNRGASAQTFMWRVRARDTENNTEWAESEVYSLIVTPQLSATYTSELDKEGNFTVELKPNGGSGDRKYMWSGMNISKTQSQLKDQKGLKPGDYKVYITDDCGSFSLPIQLTTK